MLKKIGKPRMGMRPKFSFITPSKKNETGVPNHHMAWPSDMRAAAPWINDITVTLDAPE